MRSSRRDFQLFIGQYRIILSADTASEVRQLLSQKRGYRNPTLSSILATQMPCLGNADAVPQPPKRCLSR